MRRIAVPLLAAVVLGAAVAGAARLSSARADAHAAKKTKLTVWVGWSARELKEFKSVVAEYQAKHPELQIKVIGYDPFWGFYSGNFTDMTNYAPLFGAKYYNAKGKAALASSFAWSKLLRWQKSLIDWYGYTNVVRFQSGLGDEFSASNAFEIGKIAMMMDGEWRGGVIKTRQPPPTHRRTAPPPRPPPQK